MELLHYHIGREATNTHTHTNIHTHRHTIINVTYDNRVYTQGLRANQLHYGETYY